MFWKIEIKNSKELYFLCQINIANSVSRRIYGPLRQIDIRYEFGLKVHLKDLACK